ncbi:MAG TPA: hypothetical protein VFV33_13980 [Gemmatimonadaceae bacterium]|nr:hypothetical protein [Gemmatimonadaceae bacterium]
MPHAHPARTVANAVALAAMTLALSAVAGAPKLHAIAENYWIVYLYDESGNYQGRRNVEHPLADGSRWACRGERNCRPCEACHTATQLGDRRYTATYDVKRHQTEHYPRLAISLAAGQSVAWGASAALRNRDTELVITNAAGTKDVMVFPAGSLALRDPRGAARLVLLPPNLAPRLP